MKPTFKKVVLDNGLRVLLAPMPKARSTACFVMIAAGSRYETAETSGIAHFAEHMFFKGTKRRPTAQDIAATVDGFGGEFNAFTGKECTAYYIHSGADYRSLALDVLADMLRYSVFDPEEIEREKGVIVEEMNMYEDSPKDSVSELYEGLIFGNQPLGWDIVGTKETVCAATQKTFFNYLDRWYQPSRMVVGIGGRFDRRVVKEVEHLFGDLPARATGKAPPVDLALAQERVKVKAKPSEQGHFCLGVPGLPLGHSDHSALNLLKVVLGGGMSSRLFTEVRERRGLAYYVFAHHQAYTDSGLFYAQAGVDVKRIDAAVVTVAEEFHKIARLPILQEELDKARNYLKGHTELSLEGPKGLISWGLRRETLEGKVSEPTKTLAALDLVTVEDVQRVAEELFQEGAFRLAVVGPFDDASRFERLLA